MGCEPGVLESEDGRMGLSDRVAAAVEPAVNMIQNLIGDLSAGRSENFGRAKIVKPNHRSESKSYRRYYGRHDNVALLAWEILGAIVALIIIIFVIMMIPEMRRYLRLKSM